VSDTALRNGRPPALAGVVNIHFRQRLLAIPATLPSLRRTITGDAAESNWCKQAWVLKKGRGKMVRPNWSQSQNTTISAIIAAVRIQPHFLRLLGLVDEDPTKDTAEYEAEIRSRIPDYDSTLQVPRVIVWHNAVARIPFPKTLFCGQYDTHFGIVPAAERVVEQDVTYEGSGVHYRLKSVSSKLRSRNGSQPR
jgi:hypothetical protein